MSMVFGEEEEESVQDGRRNNGFDRHSDGDGDEDEDVNQTKKKDGIMLKKALPWLQW